jgi:hypothetical protein
MQHARGISAVKSRLDRCPGVYRAAIAVVGDLHPIHHSALQGRHNVAIEPGAAVAHHL